MQGTDARALHPCAQPGAARCGPVRTGGGVDSGTVESFLAAAAALVPPIGVGLLFAFAIRSLVHADRNERTALARMDAEEQARRDAAGAARRDADAG